MIDLILAAYVAIANPVKVPVKKEKIEVSKHIDMIKPDSLADYINLIDQQSKQDTLKLFIKANLHRLAICVLKD